MQTPRAVGRIFRTGGLLAALVVAAGSCARVPRFGAPDPVTSDGKRILTLWQGSVLTALAVGAIVWALMAWVVLTHRRRRRAHGPRGPAEREAPALPSQRAHNVPVEVAYTLTPVLIVAVLFGFTVFTQEKVTAKAARPDVVVDVVGYQWQWEFRYPDEGITVIGTKAEPRPTMVLPVGATVRLRLHATDVIHSFWVPRFLKKLDLVPGLDNEMDVVVEDPGRYPGRCAEFCGLDHARMDFEVEAVSPPTYQRWLAQTRAAAGPG